MYIFLENKEFCAKKLYIYPGLVTHTCKKATVFNQTLLYSATLCAVLFGRAQIKPTDFPWVTVLKRPDTSLRPV